MRTLSTALSLALLSGCVPADGGPVFGQTASPQQPLDWLQPNYDELPDECFTEEFANWFIRWTGPDGTDSHPTWADPCVLALEQDISLDRESCEPGATQDDLVFYCGIPLIGAFGLATQDFGLVADLEDGPNTKHSDYVRSRFISEMQAIAQAQGHDRMGPVIYDFVTSTILSLVVDYQPKETNGLSASMDFDTREVTIYSNLRYEDSMLTLVHESTHAWLQSHHVACAEDFVPAFMGPVIEAGTRVCDDDWSGAWGFEAATGMLAYEYAQDDPYLNTDTLTDDILAARCFINNEPCWSDKQ